MRKHYIDNIRILCILLLIPFHTFVLYNNWGEAFYVYSKPVTILSFLDVMIYPWWMTLLFALAGMSSVYALNKRSGKDYFRERVTKLFIPFMMGLLLIIPVQCYIADLFHNGYQGTYLEHYQIFFTRFTDLSGYDGGFTPAHTWFILYLFLISMISLPVMLWYNKQVRKIDTNNNTMLKLLSMFFIVILMTPILDIGGKSLGESLACFLLGFFVLSQEQVQEKLIKYWIPLTLLWIFMLFWRGYLYLNHGGQGILWDIQQRMVTWSGILAILGLGRKYLNFSNRFTKYFSSAAFSIYYFHQSILVIVAFFILKTTDQIILQVPAIIGLSYFFTIICYEVLSRFNVTCFIFGIKRKERK